MTWQRDSITCCVCRSSCSVKHVTRYVIFASLMTTLRDYNARFNNWCVHNGSLCDVCFNEVTGQLTSFMLEKYKLEY